MEFFAVMQGGSAALYQALVGGRIDAHIGTIDQMFAAEGNPNFKVLLTVTDVLPNIVRQGVAVMNKTLRERQDDVIAYAVGYGRGARYCMENPQETIALADKITGFPPGQNAKAYEWYAKNNAINPNFLITPEQIDYMQDMNLSTKQQERKLPVEQVASWDIQKAVIARLGEYQKRG
jgi:ABC-type nitrate/sulfonate/bicarbonate transport system substrate-binding protein